MDIQDFVQWWSHRDLADLECMIQALDDSSACADGEICRVRAAALVGAGLRRSGRSRAGFDAAHHTSRAVLDCCERAGLLTTDRSAVTRLARAAAEAGRGLVAAPDSEVVAELLRPFRVVLDRVAPGAA